jgi:transposase IS66 family protein
VARVRVYSAGSSVLSAERLHGDDTTVPILAKGKTDTGRAWVYVRDDGKEKNGRIYIPGPFDDPRGTGYCIVFLVIQALAGFDGFLHFRFLTQIDRTHGRYTGR